MSTFRLCPWNRVTDQWMVCRCFPQTSWVSVNLQHVSLHLASPLCMSPRLHLVGRGANRWYHHHDDVTSTKGDISPTILDIFVYLFHGAVPPSTESKIVLDLCFGPACAIFWYQVLREICASASGRISKLRLDSFLFLSRAPLEKGRNRFKNMSRPSKTWWLFLHVLFIPLLTINQQR